MSQNINIAPLVWHQHDCLYAQCPITGKEFRIFHKEGQHWASWDLLEPGSNDLDDLKAKAEKARAASILPHLSVSNDRAQGSLSGFTALAPRPRPDDEAFYEGDEEIGKSIRFTALQCAQSYRRWREETGARGLQDTICYVAGTIGMTDDYALLIADRILTLAVGAGMLTAENGKWVRVVSDV